MYEYIYIQTYKATISADEIPSWNVIALLTWFTHDWLYKCELPTVCHSLYGAIYICTYLQYKRIARMLKYTCLCTFIQLWII